MNARLKKGLIRIEVPDAGDEPLVEQQRLNGPLLLRMIFKNSSQSISRASGPVFPSLRKTEGLSVSPASPKILRKCEPQVLLKL